MKTEEFSPYKVYAKGLTLRSIFAILYSAAVIQPAIIWVHLATGNVILEAGIYATVFLFSEIAALTKKPLTKHEILVFIVGCATSGVGVFFFPTYIYNLYFRRHPLMSQITSFLPEWFSPPPNSPVWDLRTFFHKDWMIPISISLIQLFLLLIAELALGFLTTEIFVVQENLPFPVQQATAQLCSTLAERSENRLRVFIISAVISFIYSIFLYAIPTITNAALNIEVQVIPLPWIDLNHIVEKVLPGASLGVATDPAAVALGLILPTKIIISMLLGSAALFFAGNSALTQLGLFTEWSPGMTLKDAWQRSVLHFWAGPIVVFSIMAGVLPIIFHSRPFFSAIRSLSRISIRRGEERVSLKVILILYLASTLTSVFISCYLIPDFPLYIFLLMSVGWSLVQTLITTRALGVTGTVPQIPYVWQGVVLASGYTGFKAWFAPLVIGEASYWAGSFKVAELTLTSRMDLVKAFFLAFPLSLFFGLIYTQLFWTISAIPSSLFPVPFWDVNVNLTYLFISRKITNLFKTEWMFGAFISAIAIHLLAEFTNIPISTIGIATGMMLPIATPVSYLVGLLIGKILLHYFKKAWIKDQASTIFAGVVTGESLLVTLSTGIAMVLKSRWIRPF